MATNHALLGDSADDPRIKLLQTNIELILEQDLGSCSASEGSQPLPQPSTPPPVLLEDRIDFIDATPTPHLRWSDIPVTHVAPEDAYELPNTATFYRHSSGQIVGTLSPVSTRRATFTAHSPTIRPQRIRSVSLGADGLKPTLPKSSQVAASWRQPSSPQSSLDLSSCWSSSGRDPALRRQSSDDLEPRNRRESPFRTSFALPKLPRRVVTVPRSQA
eukprot:TRINITY_DN7357_c0_g1_i1.p1 TRINITY_DN7357_c0_g1~~TRINITY_DN7357_c0_g1_i1.p1  ORF type:complete len:217 (+),score=15.30 TRINITY_DN7357_c0_g1_i1:345-995(+)